MFLAKLGADSCDFHREVCDSKDAVEICPTVKFRDNLPTFLLTPRRSAPVGALKDLAVNFEPVGL